MERVDLIIKDHRILYKVHNITNIIMSQQISNMDIIDYPKIIILILIITITIIRDRIVVLEILGSFRKIRVVLVSIISIIIMGSMNLIQGYIKIVIELTDIKAIIHMKLIRIDREWRKLLLRNN